jgi:hypothetical protein
MVLLINYSVLNRMSRKAAVKEHMELLRKASEAGVTLNEYRKMKASGSLPVPSQETKPVASVRSSSRKVNNMNNLARRFAGVSVLGPSVGPSLPPRGPSPAGPSAPRTELDPRINIILAPLTGFFEVTTPVTMNQGDCMYSSIYRAARDQGFNCIIDTVLTHPSVDPPNLVAAATNARTTPEEMRFVQKARNIVADRGVHDFEEFYDIMLDNYNNNKDIYDYMMGANSTFDVKLKKLITTYIVNSKNKPAFIADWIRNTLDLDKNGNINPARAYSGEIENNVISRFILELCNITITTVTSELAYKKIAVLPNTIYIENQGGGHYEYFRIGKPLPDVQPTFEEVKKRLLRDYKLSSKMIDLIYGDSGNNIRETVESVLRISDGIPVGKNRLTNQNYGPEYMSLKARVESGSRPSASTSRRVIVRSTPATARSTRSLSNRNSKIKSLINMGFNKNKATKALLNSNGNVEDAITRLSGGRRRTLKKRS